MAAGPAIEMWSKQGVTAQYNDKKRAMYSLVRAFTVVLDANDPLEVAYQASGLPLVRDPYPAALFIVVKKLTASRLGPTLAMVTADYEGEAGYNGPTSSPIENEVSVKWRSQISDEEIDEDINGLPLVTANLEPIEGITERIPSQVAIVERNFLSINTYALESYLRSRNSDEFLGWPPGTCRLMDYSADNAITDGSAGFWRVSATFEFRTPYRTIPARAWFKRVRHEGFLVRSTPSASPSIAADEITKAPATRPVLLAADGTRITDAADAYWKEFETTYELPYSALGLI